MSTPVVKINEDASIEEAAGLMAKKRIKKLIVVSGNNDKLVGIITSTDIVKAQPKLITLVEKSMKTP
jgi:CBS domain-containing protein